MSIIFLEERSTIAKDKLYELDLKEQRIAILSGKYVILSDFMNAHYNSGDLSESFVFIASCKIMGKDGCMNEEWPNSLIS